MRRAAIIAVVAILAVAMGWVGGWFSRPATVSQLPSEPTPVEFNVKLARFSYLEPVFVAERPESFWETISASEYGFWANVNPEVPHPRWSQAEERILGTGNWYSAAARPTVIYNGYGEWVAELYKGLEGEKLYT